jgi:hypothetical protein
VTSLAIVKYFEILENGRGQLDASIPAFAVKELHLHPAPERFHHRVVEALTDPIDGKSPASRCCDDQLNPPWVP